MRFIVYGAGAVGSAVGGHLWRTNHDVILVGRSEHVDRIHQSGLRLVTPDETYLLKLPACKSAEELVPFRGDDVLLLTAKSQHTLTCLGQLKNAGSPESLPIFCVQNSICNEVLATRVFDRVYGVMITMPAIFLNPGEVVTPITGNNGFVEVGLYPSGSDELAREVSEAFRKAGYAGGVNEIVMRAKAAKCLGNLANAMQAITKGRDSRGEFMTAARKEAMEVWKAAGIEWEDEEEFQKRVQRERGTTAMPRGYENSLQQIGSALQSLLRSTGSTEAEQLNGDVVRIGRLLGIKTPYNELLWRLADEMAKNGEKPGKFTTEDLNKMVTGETRPPP